MGDVAPLLALIGEATTVLLGEATHGTHEFYQVRANLTRRLLVDRPARIAVWAHNSHVGDARATDAAARVKSRSDS